MIFFMGGTSVSCVSFEEGILINKPTAIKNNAHNADKPHLKKLTHGLFISAFQDVPENNKH